MEFYGYKKCSTCRDAHKFLAGHGLEVEFQDFVDQPPSSETLKTWIAKRGAGVAPFVNAKGTRYRELGLKDKHLTDEEWIQMMSEDGKLLKRPVLIAGNEIIVGYDKPAYQRVVDGHAGS
jgi:arsenate reductase (glutaredoxin)